VHATDATNASRTLLYDIRKGAFDDDLLELFGVPRSILPEVRDCDASYGGDRTFDSWCAVPILGVAGDQQAATIGQACFAPGMVKATYGTGCFALLNTGAEPVASMNRLLSTVAYQLGGKRTMHWRAPSSSPGLRFNGCATACASSSRPRTATVWPPPPTPGRMCILCRRSSGLGAPYWRPEARGALLGLTRGSGPNELARAALEAVCYQTRDLLEAMRGDWSADAKSVLRVDGGMVASDWTMQFLATCSMRRSSGRPFWRRRRWARPGSLVIVPGVWPDAEGFAKLWKLERAFKPTLTAAQRERKYAGWQRAVRAVLQHADG
jgi:glycerol kinase